MSLNQERNDFSKFGKSFQEKLVQLILEERTFADQIEEVLDIEFLELKYLRALTRKVYEYKEKYEKHPSFDVIKTLVDTELEEDDLIKEQIRDYFTRITDSRVDESEYIKGTSLDFCKKQKLKEAMIQSIDLLQNSSFDEISTVINDALKLGSDNNHGYDWILDFEKRFQITSRNAISTGWPEIDRICKQGLGSGELGVVIAPTGVGKSMILTHLGAAALKNGKNVVHYTMELMDTIIASRYDSCITGIELNDLMDEKNKIYEEIQDIRGRLIVKEYPTKKASPRTLRNHLNRLVKKDIKIDMVVVDYADLLRPVTKYKEKRTELESIYEDLRAIAHEFSCPIWTASQTNRTGLNAEVITMEAISEAFSKCFVADFIFSLSRTMIDKAKNSGRVFIAKNRHGPDGLIFPVFMDTSNVKINVRPQHENMINGSQISLKEQKKMLREKYKDFLINKKNGNGKNGSNVT